jgi:hypothetical protein
MYLKVMDEPNLVRDTKSNAILNVNTEALNKYKQERDNILKMQKVISEHEDLKKNISSLSNDVSEIKQLLLQFMGKN